MKERKKEKKTKQKCFAKFFSDLIILFDGVIKEHLFRYGEKMFFDLVTESLLKTSNLSYAYDNLFFGYSGFYG
jgi:hypothetical protein